MTGCDGATSDRSSLITGLAPARYEVARLEAGNKYYVDRDFTITELGAGLSDLPWIKTANDDNAGSADSAIGFTLREEAVVVVGYDGRASALPTWLSDWERAPLTIGVSDGASPLTVLYKTFTPGSVVLGGNLAAGAEGAQSMYSVLLLQTAKLAPTALQLKPVYVTLDAGARIQFSATVADPLGRPDTSGTIQWRATGGTITAEGHYQAGVTPGIYRVTATEPASGLQRSTGVSIRDTSTGGQTGQRLAIPTSAEWTYRGVALVPSVGEWDQRLPAGAPATMLKVGSTYHLYYVGASGNRPSDGGPAYRAVGLATSSDGITWTKHPSNPVIPWSDIQQNNDDEEGAWRAAAMVDDDGTVVLYLTHLIGSGGGVNGPIFLHASSDGVGFTGHHEPGSYWGEVISPADSDYPGSDEYGMLGAARSDDGSYHLWFTAKGSQSWDVVEANAATPQGFTSGSLMLELAAQVRYGSNPIRVSLTDWIMPIGLENGEIQLYRTGDLTQIGTLAQTYGDLPQSPQAGRGNFALYLDQDAGTWFLLTANDSSGDSYARITVLTAPVTLVKEP